MLEDTIKVYEFDILDSTNEYIKRNLDKTSNITVVRTNYQTSGKGRMGRKFVSNKDENLLFSIFLNYRFIVRNFETFSLFCGYVLCLTLEKYNLKPMIKWPNDILINSKKISGILLEGCTKEKEFDSIIAGIGININQVEFLNLPFVTSLKLETGKTQNIDEFFNCFISIFEIELEKFFNKDFSFMNYIRSHNLYIGEYVDCLYYEKNIKVKIIDILENGHLLFEYNGEIIETNSIEISFHK